MFFLNKFRKTVAFSLLFWINLFKHAGLVTYYKGIIIEISDTLWTLNLAVLNGGTFSVSIQQNLA